MEHCSRIGPKLIKILVIPRIINQNFRKSSVKIQNLRGGYRIIVRNIYVDLNAYLEFKGIPGTHSNQRSNPIYSVIGSNSRFYDILGSYNRFGFVYDLQYEVTFRLLQMISRAQRFNSIFAVLSHIHMAGYGFDSRGEPEESTAKIV